MESAPTLLNRGPLDERQLQLARDALRVAGSLDAVAGQLGLASEEQVLAAIAEALGLDVVDLAATPIDLSLLRDFPTRIIHRHAVFPVRREDDSLRGGDRQSVRSARAWTRSARRPA